MVCLQCSVKDIVFVLSSIEFVSTLIKFAFSTCADDYAKGVLYPRTNSCYVLKDSLVGYKKVIFKEI